MKKFLALVLSGAMIFSTVPIFASAKDKNYLTVNSEWSVLIKPDASKQEKYAAKKLGEKLSEIFSCTVPVVSYASDKFIAVGSDSGADVSSVAENGYIIKAGDDGNIYINGTGKRGNLYGVYRFLEEFCGVKNYTKALTVTPKTDSVSVEDDAFVKYEPFFEYAITDGRSCSGLDYAVANGLSGCNFDELNNETGGAVSYLGSFCHTLTGQFCSAGKYFKDHPEYFAYRDGKRIPDQLCLTNPDMLELVKKEVMELLKTGHNPEATLQMISLTQADNYNYCTCENCQAFADAHGGAQSALMVNFVNQIADMVKAAGYENVALDTFAYQYTRMAPKGIVPRDNMIIRICTIESCYAHPLDSKCERNVAIMKDIEDWSKICKRIYIWGYANNYANTCCVFPDFGVIQKNIQMYYEHNVKGVYEESNYYFDKCDTEFIELRTYMIAKCLQNPYCNLDEEMNGFLEAYYGPGGKYIRTAIDEYSKCAGDRKGHIWIYQASKDSLYMNDFQVQKVDNCWKKAKEAAVTQTQLENIERSELSWRYYKANANKGEFSVFNPERFDEKQKLFDDLVASGVTTLNEWMKNDKVSFIDCAAVRYAKPDEWYAYKAGDEATEKLLKKGRFLENFTPIYSFGGIFYDLFSALFKVCNNLFGSVC